MRDSLPMKNTSATPLGAGAKRSTPSGGLQAWLPRLVLAPSVAISLFFVYGFMLWTFVLSEWAACRFISCFWVEASTFPFEPFSLFPHSPPLPLAQPGPCPSPYFSRMVHRRHRFSLIQP